MNRLWDSDRAADLAAIALAVLALLCVVLSGCQVETRLKAQGVAIRELRNEVQAVKGEIQVHTATTQTAGANAAAATSGSWLANTAANLSGSGWPLAIVMVVLVAGAVLLSWLWLRSRGVVAGMQGALKDGLAYMGEGESRQRFIQGVRSAPVGKGVQKALGKAVPK